MNLGRELNQNLWKIILVDGVLWNDLEADCGGVLDDLDGCVCRGLKATTLWCKCDILIDHCDRVAICCCYVDSERVCCLLVVWLLEAVNEDLSHKIAVRDVAWANTFERQ